MRWLKLKDVDKDTKIFPHGEWRLIASTEEDINNIIDDNIYFYVDSTALLQQVAVGDIIELDEKFKVIDAEEWKERYGDEL